MDKHTIVRHGQDRNLRDGSISAFYTTGSLVDGGQVSVHVSGITTTTWDFFSSSGNFSQGVAVGRKIGKNDENMLLELVCVVFGGRQSKTRSNNALDSVFC